MGNLKRLSVTVTYKVGLENVEASEEVIKQLNEIADNGGEVDGNSHVYGEAIGFLTDHVRERDAHD